MSLVCVPRREDFFPKTKRGHGSKRPHPITKKVGEDWVHILPLPCVDHTCVLNMPKSTNLHEDREANLRDWCEEHGLSVESKARPNARFEHPSDAMLHATGAR